MTAPDPLTVLREAGVTCPEVEDYRDVRYGEHDHDSLCAAADDMANALAQLVATERERARKLECCGSCANANEFGLWCEAAANLGHAQARGAGWPTWYSDGSFNVHVHLGDPCHFARCRWEARHA